MNRELSLIVAAGLVLAGLGGCGVVTTETPLLTDADVTGGPRLMSGLWVITEPGCKFKPRSNPQTWPECAIGFEVRGGTLRDLTPDRAAERKADPKAPPRPIDQPMRYLVAGGDPAIVQVESADGSGGVSSFNYLGLRPLASDAGGTVTRARLWFTRCSPPKRAAVAVEPRPPKRTVTPTLRGGPSPTKVNRPKKPPSSLYPGLVTIPGSEQGCTAKTVGGLRSAVVANEAHAFTGAKDDTGHVAQWLRDDGLGQMEQHRRGLLGQAFDRAKTVGRPPSQQN